MSVGDVERKRRDGAEPADADARAVFECHVFETVCRIAHVVENGGGKTSVDRILVFHAGHGEGAVGQYRAGRAFDADAVEFVAAHGGCAAGAETQGGGYVVTFARIDEADLPARDEGADFFVFRREIIARAAEYALHGG